MMAQIETALAPFHSDEAMLRFGDRFMAQDVPAGEWTHAAHFAVALYLIAMREDLDAERDMPGLIRALNEAHGVPNSDTSGYHHTITLASLGAARDRLEQNPPATPVVQVLGLLLRGRYGRKDWMLEHWSRETLFSARARAAWVGPDLAPLPFAAIAT